MLLTHTHLLYSLSHPRTTSLQGICQHKKKEREKRFQKAVDVNFSTSKLKAVANFARHFVLSEKFVMQNASKCAEIRERDKKNRIVWERKWKREERER